MSFDAPVYLLSLVLVPLLLVAYLVAQRRRQRYAVRFANLPVLASVVGKGPGWRRHVPPALALLALTALAFALARPQITRNVARDEASIILVVDSSGSMQATDVSPDRLDAARAAIGKLIDNVPSRVRIGAVSFSQTAVILQRPTTEHQQVNEALATLVPGGGTATGEAINTALRALQPPPGAKRPPSAIVLLSDGKKTSGKDPVVAAREARRLKVPISTVALGTPDGVIEVQDNFGDVQRLSVPPDPEALKAIAKTSGGRFFDAPDAEKLKSVYAGLGSQLGTKRERSEITVAFAGGALVLLVAGALTSLLWFGRLP